MKLTTLAFRVDRCRCRLHLTTHEHIKTTGGYGDLGGFHYGWLGGGTGPAEQSARRPEQCGGRGGGAGCARGRADAAPPRELRSARGRGFHPRVLAAGRNRCRL